GDPVARLDADDGAGLDPHHVAGAKERDVAGHGLRERGDADAGARELELHLHLGAQLDRAVEVRARDLVGETAPEPRQEGVGRDGFAHAALSKLGITWSVSARVGSSATLRSTQPRARASRGKEAASAAAGVLPRWSAPVSVPALTATRSGNGWSFNRLACESGERAAL